MRALLAIVVVAMLAACERPPQPTQSPPVPKTSGADAQRSDGVRDAR